MKIVFPELLISAMVRRATRRPFMMLGALQRGWLMDPKSIPARLTGVTMSINHIKLSDHRRHPHDHRCSYVEIVLRGGFTEVLLHDTLIDAHRYGRIHRAEHGMPEVQFNKEMNRWESHAYYGPGSVLARGAKTAHRILVAKGESATTLMIALKPSQACGFITPAGKMEYQAYIDWLQFQQDEQLLDALGREEIAKAYGVTA